MRGSIVDLEVDRRLEFVKKRMKCGLFWLLFGPWFAMVLNGIWLCEWRYIALMLLPARKPTMAFESVCGFIWVSKALVTVIFA